MLNEAIFHLFYLLFHLLVFLIPKHFFNFLERAVYSVKRLNVNLLKIDTNKMSSLLVRA